jgi:pro-apoptotic serine protease NMA111
VRRILVLVGLLLPAGHRGERRRAVPRHRAKLPPTRPTGRARCRASPPVWCRSASTRPRAFDTDWNQSTQATGFVVDAERGIVLTNRHVVMPGPGQGRGRVPQPGRGRTDPAVPRSGARFRLLPLRPARSCGSSIRSSWRCRPTGRGRPRDPRGRQRRRRAAVDPRRHDRAAGPRGARLRSRPVQRLQHVLHAGGVRDLRRFVRLAGDRHRGRGRRAERRRARAGRSRASSCRWIASQRALELVQRRRTGAARHAADDLRHRPYDELGRLGLDEETEARIRDAHPERKGMLVVRRHACRGRLPRRWSRATSCSSQRRVAGDLRACPRCSTTTWAHGAS